MYSILKEIIFFSYRDFKQELEEDTDKIKGKPAAKVLKVLPTPITQLNGAPKFTRHPYYTKISTDMEGDYVDNVIYFHFNLH